LRLAAKAGSEVANAASAVKANKAKRMRAYSPFSLFGLDFTAHSSNNDGKSERRIATDADERPTGSTERSALPDGWPCTKKKKEPIHAGASAIFDDRMSDELDLVC
jgi:hypothetical protein